jgi:RimJ/RimL family protein N-acetyltransferase
MRSRDDPVSCRTVTLRPATIDDAPLVFEWRNDPDIQAISGTTKELKMHDHLKWFAARLQESHAESIYMVEGSEAGTIGTARILQDGTSHARISLTIASEYRGRGIGRKVIRLLKNKIDEMSRIAVARVHTENLTSLRAFMSVGFHIIALEGKFIELHSEKQ